MNWWPFKRKEPEPPPPPPEDEPLWLIVDRELAAAGVPRATRRDIAVRVENWELRRALKELHTIPRTIMVNPVHKPVQKPRVTKPQEVTRNRVKRARSPKKRNRANYMRDYRARLRVVTRNGDAA
jgi:hypothetical protein